MIILKIHHHPQQPSANKKQVLLHLNGINAKFLLSTRHNIPPGLCRNAPNASGKESCPFCQHVSVLLGTAKHDCVLLQP